MHPTVQRVPKVDGEWGVLSANSHVLDVRRAGAVSDFIFDVLDVNPDVHGFILHPGGGDGETLTNALRALLQSSAGSQSGPPPGPPPR